MKTEDVTKELFGSNHGEGGRQNHGSRTGPKPMTHEAQSLAGILYELGKANNKQQQQI